jgi:ribosomal protein S18 acetylase RimI-like enzyme
MSLERHDPQAVAQLIYESAPELFRLLFGRTAVGVIQTLVRRSHNRFSYRYVYVAETADQVVGIATLLPASRLNQNTDYQSVLNVWLRFRRQIADWLILNRVLKRHYPADSCYIANLAVHSAHRGQGIGTQLLRHCIAHATQTGAKQIFISVDIDNPRAQKLYESLGFQVVAVKTLSLLTITIGSRVLMLTCKGFTN